MSAPQNPYLPQPARIEAIKWETGSGDIKTFRVRPLPSQFDYIPGQFAEVSVFGEGEAPFSIASSPTRAGFLEFAVKRVGTVTMALHSLREGDIIGVRGPFGNGFPLDKLKGKGILFIGGGIGIAPLRSLIGYVLDQRECYGKVTILNGARSPGDLVFRDEYSIWRSSPDTEVVITVDRGEPGWNGPVGFVPQVLRELAPGPHNTVAVTCGPPVMIRYVIETLTELGFPPDAIITTLEMRMTCGVGKCGRCNIGHLYVCRDGPVFSYEEMRRLPGEY